MAETLVTNGVSSGAESVPALIQSILLNYLNDIQVSGDYLNQIANLYPVSAERVDEIQVLLNDAILQIQPELGISSTIVAEGIEVANLVNEVLLAMRNNSISNVPPDIIDGSTDAEIMLKDAANAIFEEFNLIIEPYDDNISLAVGTIISDLNAYKSRLESTQSWLRISRNEKTVAALSQLTGSTDTNVDKLIKNIAGGPVQVITAFFGEEWDAALVTTKTVIEDAIVAIENALNTEDSTLAEAKLDELRALLLDYAEYLPTEQAANLRNGTW
jgi:hypothetical protein